jgi:histidinol-phosphate/aromatic aminotransferase/cobyric acid decarboxylase-like protein
VLEALRTGEALVEARAAAVAAERRRLSTELRELGVEVAPSQANVLWLRLDSVDGAEAAHRLERQGVLVAPGGPLGGPGHVRATIRGREASERLVRAVRGAMGRAPQPFRG